MQQRRSRVRAGPTQAVGPGTKPFGFSVLSTGNRSTHTQLALHTEYAYTDTYRVFSEVTAVGIREGILALLADGPKYGYQLKREFEIATGEAWALNVGQVYTTIQRLERDGLVEFHETDDKDRNSYRITEPGQGVFVAWMTHPIEPSVANRDDLSMKVLLAMASGVVDTAVVIEVQRVSTMTALQDYQALRGETAETDLAWMLHLDRLVFQAEAELRWLDRIEDRIEQVSPANETTAATTTRAAEIAMTRVAGSTND